MQSKPQSMPAGLLTIRPPAGPVAVISVTILVLNVETATRLKVAVQFTLVLSVTLPSAQSAGPDQPEKMEPLAATAVKVTTVPVG